MSPPRTGTASQTVAMTQTSEAAPTLALAARGIGVSFGGLRALDDVDLDVAPGEIVGIIGPNGAGKTTLFDCLSGFLACDGDVWVAGNMLTGVQPHRRAAAGLGRSFQDARLFPTMTVLDALRVACDLARGATRSQQASTRLALDLIESMSLSAYRDKLVRELSTGTRRIVDLACVIAQNPIVVLLDEPSSGIAQREAEALGGLLRRIRESTGCAMVLIEHDMPLLLGLADRVYALETGQVVAVGNPDDVVHHPEVIRSYLGADPAAINRSDNAAADAPKPKRAPRKKRSESS
ncbi:MAG: ABC transporter ATP-binding protein [Actinomycetota bacterium]